MDKLRNRLKISVFYKGIREIEARESLASISQSLVETSEVASLINCILNIVMVVQKEVSLISDTECSVRVSERGIEFLTCSSSSSSNARFGSAMPSPIRAFYLIGKRVESMSACKGHFGSKIMFC